MGRSEKLSDCRTKASCITSISLSTTMFLGPTRMLKMPPNSRIPLCSNGRMSVRRLNRFPTKGRPGSDGGRGRCWYSDGTSLFRRLDMNNRTVRKISAKARRSRKDIERELSPNGRSIAASSIAWLIPINSTVENGFVKRAAARKCNVKAEVQEADKL